MEPSTAAGGQDHGSGFDVKIMFRLQIHQHCAGNLPLVVQDQFHRRGELDNLNIGSIAHLVAQNPHDFDPGIVAGRVHAFTAGAATVGLDHGSIKLFVEHNPQVFEPLDDWRGIFNQRFDQVRDVGEVTAADYVQVMDGRGVFGPVGGLDTPLGHGGIGIAEAQFGD